MMYWCDILAREHACHVVIVAIAVTACHFNSSSGHGMQVICAAPFRAQPASFLALVL